MSKLFDFSGRESNELALQNTWAEFRQQLADEKFMFFGGKVWEVSLAKGGEELLGHDIVEQAREKIIWQYENYLQDVVIFAENKYNDMLTLQRVKLSIEFLRKGLVI